MTIRRFIAANVLWALMFMVCPYPLFSAETGQSEMNLGVGEQESLPFLTSQSSVVKALRVLLELAPEQAGFMPQAKKPLKTPLLI